MRKFTNFLSVFSTVKSYQNQGRFGHIEGPKMNEYSRKSWAIFILSTSLISSQVVLQVSLERFEVFLAFGTKSWENSGKRNCIRECQINIFRVNY